MVCKIHKNIKSSLRETIKGRDAQSTSNTILSCALAASTHLHPPLLSFPFLPVSHFLSAFLSFYSISSKIMFCAGLSFCTHPTVDVLLSHRRCVATSGRPSSLWRCSEAGRGRKNKLLLMQFWHCALDDGTSCRKKTTTTHNREALLTQLLPL